MSPGRYPPGRVFGPLWDYVFDLRADDASGVTPPLLTPDLLVGKPRQVTSDTDGGAQAGWTARGLLFRRPEAVQNRQYDWALTLTRPDGVTAAVVSESLYARFAWEIIRDLIPGLGKLLAPRADRPPKTVEPESYLRWWRHVEVLHAAICDPGSWYGDPSGPLAHNRNPAILLRGASFGLPDFQTLKTWKRIGVLARANTFDGWLPWADEGFTPEQAQPWLPVGDSQAARQWVDAGQPVERALAWRPAFEGGTFLKPEQVDRLEAAGWTPALVSHLIQAYRGDRDGLGSSMAMARYLGRIIGPDSSRATPARLVHRLPPARLIGYVRAGVTDLDEIDAFEASGQPPSDEQLATMAALRGMRMPPPMGLVPV